MLIEIASDLYNAGTNADDEIRDGLSFYLVATLPDGTRFAHEKRFLSPSRGYRQGAETQVGTLLAKVETAMIKGTWHGPCNNPHWQEVQPVYGSEAYCKNYAQWERD